MQDNFSIYDYFPLIRLSDEKYPMYMPQVRASTTQTSFPMPIKAYMLEPFGYMPVYAGEYPTEGDVITEGKPAFNEEEGKWYRTWDIREFTEEEKAQNLINAKAEAISRAENVLGTDTYNGITYTYNDEPYGVEINPEKLTILLCIKSLAKDAADDATFEFSFMDQKVLTLTKEEFLSMWNTVMSTYYEMNKRYWKFRDDVKLVTEITAIPEVPETFKP